MNSDPSEGQSERVYRFKPKPNKKRPTVLPKTEKEEIVVDQAKAEHLLRRFKESSSKGGTKPERKAAPVEVAFGSGESSRSLKSYGSANIHKNGAASQRMEKAYVEPWDYYSNYPTTLPIRKPYSGDPEVLNREEFGDNPVNAKHVKNNMTVVEQLGLLDEGSNDNMFFLQLPPMVPPIAQPVDSKVNELENKPNPSKGPSNNVPKLCNLASLPAGLIGKLLVYKSGAVKLKIADAEFEVSPGVKSTCAQDIVAINVEKQHCCRLSEVNNWANATPSLSAIIDSMSQL